MHFESKELKQTIRIINHIDPARVCNGIHSEVNCIDILIEISLIYELLQLYPSVLCKATQNHITNVVEITLRCTTVVDHGCSAWTTTDMCLFDLLLQRLCSLPITPNGQFYPAFFIIFRHTSHLFKRTQRNA